MPKRLLIVACLILSLPWILPVSAQTIWFAPPDNLPRGNRVFGPDFASLFDVNAPWSKALSRIQVFELTPRYTFASSEADLRLVLTFLRNHNIQLAIGMQAVTQRGDCGRGEGYTPANGPAAIIKRLKKLGADIKYVSMDEPFFFGHQSTGRSRGRMHNMEARSIWQVVNYTRLALAV